LPEEAVRPASQLVYVIHKEPEVRVRVAEMPTVKAKRWLVFVAGMATSLVLGSNCFRVAGPASTG
jgi:type VI secretion system protein VasL